eukprot:165810-Chlamydomonas_euryale.AAC.1
MMTLPLTHHDRRACHILSSSCCPADVAAVLCFSAISGMLPLRAPQHTTTCSAGVVRGVHAYTCVHCRASVVRSPLCRARTRIHAKRAPHTLVSPHACSCAPSCVAVRPSCVA